MVVVNTCAFIEEAQQESIDTILEVVGAQGAGRREGPRRRLHGQPFGKELAREIPEIDGFVGLDQLREVGDLVQLGGGPPLPAPAHMVFDHTAPRLLDHPRLAYLKVAEGCNSPCTFCAIPLARPLPEPHIESLVAEARELAPTGIRELNLVAQDTTYYGEDLGLRRHGLVRLVEALLDATDIHWIRFLYAYPTTLDEELLRLMGSEPRFCSYLDMPLQHSHGDMLAAMRRGGDARRYLRLLERARELVPDVFLRSTFIVGFPGETEEHFEDLLAFIREARLDHLGAFAYSPEEGTPSAALAGRVPRQTARRRLRQLLEAQRPIALEHAQRDRVVGRDEQARPRPLGAATERLRHAADLGRDDRQAPGERLGHDHAVRLRARRQHEQVRAGVAAGERGAGPRPREGHAVAQLAVPGAAPEALGEHRIAVQAAHAAAVPVLARQPRERVEQHVVSLPGDHRRDAEERPGGRRPGRDVGRVDPRLRDVHAVVRQAVQLQQPSAASSRSS